MKTQFKNSDTVLVVTLGCSKNIVDSEKLMSQLSEQSLKVEYNNENSDARIVIINTCGFINNAKQESIDVILSFINKKQKGLIDKLFVIGCLSQRFADSLRKELPEVDRFFGVNCIKNIIESLGYNYKENLTGERILTTPSHYAYLKIAEGCNRKCAFCAIPLIRGSYASLSIEDLKYEATLLAEKGVKELMLIAQDLSSFGTDLYKTPMLANLVERLSKINGIEWIRLHYAYPLDFPIELLSIIRDNPKVCKYLDIPFQHISDNMLKIMRRGQNKKQTIILIDNIRKTVPNIALRTTLLVGHPGECDRDFEELIRFVETTRFERLGIFTYSHEEDTYAAKHYKDNIPVKIKQQRADRIMALQQSISLEINKKRIGQEYITIIDRIENDYYIGRTEFDSPEVDNEIIVKSEKLLKPGNFYQVKITDAKEFDLVGIVI